MHIPSDGPLDYQTGLAPSEQREKEGQGKKRVTVGGGEGGVGPKEHEKSGREGKMAKKINKKKRGEDVERRRELQKARRT